MKKINITIIIVILALAGFYVGNKIVNNKPSVETPGNLSLHIVTSFYPMYFFASQIAGDKADVYNVTPASAEPHDYEPTTQDIARIENSNLLVLNGGKLEAWGDKVKDTLQGSDVNVVTAGEGLADRTIEEEGKTIQDPHVWLDPILAKKEVAKITVALIAVDPKDTAYFQKNEKVLNTKLDMLNQSYKIGLTSCQKKDIVTSHAAFGYLGAQYGLNQVAISGVSPDEEPSAQKLAELADFVKKNDIKVIFFESLVSPKLSQTIANETGSQTLVLDPIEGIPEEQLKQGENYFTIMKQNLINLQTALKCSK
ncbi:MAG TPA: zinc ABC transporter substrate-binding protein [Candidatus Saccharimonadales bacterium]|nr:zinc ABC transporter substrate-binding protein [Candidatus Saccharimonadales bacterium]